MILETRQLRKCFGSVIVADSLDFAVAAGDAVGIIGPNGAGKSTLFNLIMGEVASDAGEILLAGKDITKALPHVRCHAGLARSYQVPRPFENLTVFENLLVAAVYGRGAREHEAAAACSAILARCRLAHRADVLAGSLTLLDRKRLELARALATEPKVLLLDEIAGGLTEGECHELVELIRSIHASGTTLVWIEHIVSALVAAVSRLVVLDFGKKIADGEPRAVMQLPQVRETYLGIPA